MLKTLYNLLREYISHPISYKSDYVGPVLDEEAYDLMNEYEEQFEKYFSDKCYAKGDIVTPEMVREVWDEIAGKLNIGSN